MLYEIDLESEASVPLTPVPFESMKSVGKLEKDLERVIADNLFDVLFEEGGLLPIHQERKGQAVGDIYAVNRDGDLVIFELKPEGVGRGALSQIFRYTEEAGRWSYRRLGKLYRDYAEGEDGDDPGSLAEAHGDAYGLEAPLPPHEFNRRQQLLVVGNAADENLIDAIDYWKQQGVNIHFVAYRLYELHGHRYFEFFSFPYDRHRNPSERRGVLFDTNRSWKSDGVWIMMEEARVAAWGSSKKYVDHLRKGDIIFFYHVGRGVVAAGEVKSEKKVDDRNGETEWYRDVDFLTPTPKDKNDLKCALSPGEIVDLLEQNFYWASTRKTPTLDWDEAQTLLKHLQEKLTAE